MQHTHRGRAAWAILALCAGLGVGYAVWKSGMAETGVQSGCPFHDVTGLNCPGCGMTRAAHAALRGHLAEAFRFNPVGMILVPWVVLGLGTEGLAWVVGKPAPFRLWPGLTGTWCLTALLAVFWILRNLPWYPFTLLSPPV